MRRNLTEEYEVSPIIKGGWQLAEDHSDNKSNTPIEDMFAFVDAGITTFDCADIYTGVEELIGQFRTEYEDRRGEDAPVQVHTKFVPDRDKLDDVTFEYVEEIIDRSRRRLGVDTLDLVQFHWWNWDVDGYVEAAQMLAELRDEGKIANIGVTNTDVPHLEEIMDGGVPVVSNQVQYSLLDNRPEHGMTEFAERKDVDLLAYGTLAGGFLTDQYLGVPEPERPLENRSLTKYKLIIEESGGWKPFQDLLEAMTSIADKHGVSVANVASRFVLEQPQVCSVIIGARDTKHLEDNLRVLDFGLDDEDTALIREKASELEDVPGGIYSVERDQTSEHARIMKYNLNEDE